MYGQLMATCPHKRKFLFLVLCVRVCGGKAINCVPAHAQRTFLFSFLGPASTFHLHSLRSSAGPEKEKIKKCCAGTSCWVNRRPAGKKKRIVIRSSVPTAASFSFSFCYWPANIILWSGQYKKNRKRRNEWTWKGIPKLAAINLCCHKDFRPAGFSFLNVHSFISTY